MMEQWNEWVGKCKTKEKSKKIKDPVGISPFYLNLISTFCTLRITGLPEICENLP
jgi:hypothetical protein